MTKEPQSEYDMAALMQEAIDCLPNGFAILDGSLQPIIANRASRQCFPEFHEALEKGLSFDEANFAGFRRAFPNATEDDVWQIANRIKDSLLSGETVNLATMDGRVMKTKYEPMSFERWVAVSIDITDQIRREKELRISRRQAEAANQAKSAFLANISHEIRTPLNGILGMAQVLVQGNLSGEQREQAEIILESGKMLRALLDDVLDLSKIEAGRMELAPVEKDLRHLMVRQVRLWQRHAEEKGIALRLTIDDDVPSLLQLDAVRLGQCLSNLISNAVKFTADGEVLVRVSAKAGTGAALISIDVTDSGIGMTPETIERLFAPFSQADSSISRRFGGTGLGLVITRKLAQLMGGNVSVVSEEGKGSTFTLTFLAETVDASALPQQPQRQRQPLPVAGTAVPRGKRVLLVDDHPLNRRVGQLFLAPEGYLVTEAENGQVALEKLAREPFDLVLLDIHMPVMDGIETLRRIRSSGQPWQSVPVIALTADAMSGDRDRYMAEGMNGYVSKPIEQRDLLAEMTRLLGGTGREPTAATKADDDEPGPQAKPPCAQRQASQLDEKPACAPQQTPEPISADDVASLLSEMDFNRKSAGTR